MKQKNLSLQSNHGNHGGGGYYKQKRKRGGSYLVTAPLMKGGQA